MFHQTLGAYEGGVATANRQLATSGNVCVLGFFVPALVSADDVARCFTTNSCWRVVGVAAAANRFVPRDDFGVSYEHLWHEVFVSRRSSVHMDLSSIKIRDPISELSYVKGAAKRRIDTHVGSPPLGWAPSDWPFHLRE